MRCQICLCRVCNKIQCDHPNHKFKCSGCRLRVPITDCDRFLNKQIPVYRINSRSRSLTRSQLEFLQKTISDILSDK